MKKALICLLLVGAAVPAPVQLAQLTLHERIIIHVAAQAEPEPVTWQEHKGPRCIAVADIGGAGLSQPDQIDFVLRGGSRVRAKLEGACPNLQYYRGFYLRPDEEGQVCQGRDAVHARSGGECLIAKFRKLVPKAAR